ncbi:hypothetical protein MNBD_ALPHA11-514 [hydrothermal vent metagenome]|uniref:Transcriptional regulator, LysR family n=1 Tax=hydrothermal vent metagenome TaxID=652676 RepID=A0A3B0UY07_9ZZZZ
MWFTSKHNSVPVWLTTHRELDTSSRIRLIFDLLVQRFSMP